MQGRSILTKCPGAVMECLVGVMEAGGWDVERFYTYDLPLIWPFLPSILQSVNFPESVVGPSLLVVDQQLTG